MTDQYRTYARGLESPAQQHFLIVPADGVDLPDRPRMLRVLTGGDLSMRDINGVVVTMTVLACETIYFSPVGIEATGTTATVVGWV